MADAGAALRRLAARAERLNTDWPADAAELTAPFVERELAAATGGDGALSGDTSLGRATVTVETGSGRASVVASGSRRVWAIVERGSRGRRQGGSSPAKRPFAKGVDAVRGRIGETVRQAGRAVMSGG